MKIDKLKKEFDINLSKNKIRNSFDFNNKNSPSKDSKPIQMKTNNSKILLIYNTSNKLFQHIPNRGPIPRGVFKEKKHPTIQHNNSYFNFNKGVDDDPTKKGLNLQISNSLKLFKSSSKKHYHTITNWTRSKPTNQLMTKNIKNMNSISTVQSTDDHRNNLHQIRAELKQKEILITKLNEQISSQKSRIEELEGKFSRINNKYQKINDEKCEFLHQHQMTQKEVSQLRKENESLKQYQLKLVKVMYILNENGIETDSILNSVCHMENYTKTNTNSRLNESLEDIKFPLKVQNVITEDNNLKTIPKLDFNKVYMYQTASLIEEDGIKKKNLKQQECNIAFKQFNNYNKETGLGPKLQILNYSNENDNDKMSKSIDKQHKKS